MKQDNNPAKKIVFALTSAGSDIFSFMTRLAIASIRQTNPGIRFTVSCDHETEIALKSKKDPLYKEVDDWMVINTPEGEPRFRNRFVKTSLRKYVDGPFLYLDSDILVRGDLGPVFKISADVAGARNNCAENFEKQAWDKDLEIINAMGWTTGSEVYVNGGVFFYNDTPGACAFADLYHRKWLEAYLANGRYRDQPALNSALHESGAGLHVLPDRFNAQVETSVKAAWDACVWHFYYSGKNRKETAYEILLDEFHKTGRTGFNQMRKMIKRKHPWRRSSVLDDLVAGKINRQGYKTSFDKAWVQGHRLSAVRTWLNRYYSRGYKNARKLIPDMKTK